MSAEVRTALVEACSTVGVKCAPYATSTAAAGDGYVRRGKTTDDQFGSSVVWEVVVMLPTQITAAEKELDRVVPLLRGALAYELLNVTLEPVTVRFDTTSKPALLVRGTREEE